MGIDVVLRVPAVLVEHARSVEPLPGRPAEEPSELLSRERGRLGDRA